MNDLSGNRTRVYAVRGRRLDRLTNRPENRGDVIRTRDLCVPNAALYQTEPRLDTFCIIMGIEGNVNYILKKVFSFVVLIYIIYKVYGRQGSFCVQGERTAGLSAFRACESRCL